MDTMRAAVVYGQNQMKVETVPIPEVPAGSFRIKVKACAICGTDMRIYKKGDYRASYPVITGHEIAGIVDEVAPGVTSVKKVTAYVLPPAMAAANVPCAAAASQTCA